MYKFLHQFNLNLQGMKFHQDSAKFQIYRNNKNSDESSNPNIRPNKISTDENKRGEVCNYGY